MKTNSFAGRTALVTGASSGLGADFARQLGAQGAHLILTARRHDALEALKAEILARHPALRIEIVVQDLSQPDAVDRLQAEVDKRGLTVDILVNNAGSGAYGAFDEIPWDKERTMLQLDIVTVVKATRTFAAGMKRRGWGRILQVASIGAFQASPLYASYGAAKAFVLNYGIAVNHELKGSGVTCTVLSPGITATEFLKVAEQKPTLYQRTMMMSSSVVVKVGLRALRARRRSVVPGLGNKAAAFATRFMGRGVAAALAERLMQ